MNTEIVWDIMLFLTSNVEKKKFTPTIVKPANMEEVKQKNTLLHLIHS